MLPPGGGLQCSVFFPSMTSGRTWAKLKKQFGPHMNKIFVVVVVILDSLAQLLWHNLYKGYYGHIYLPKNVYFRFLLKRKTTRFSVGEGSGLDGW